MVAHIRMRTDKCSLILTIFSPLLICFCVYNALKRSNNLFQCTREQRRKRNDIIKKPWLKKDTDTVFFSFISGEDHINSKWKKNFFEKSYWSSSCNKCLGRYYNLRDKKRDTERDSRTDQIYRERQRDRKKI